MPSMPSISPLELKTSVMPSVYRTMRSPGSSCNSRLGVVSTASGNTPTIALRKNVDKGHPSAQVAHRLGVDSVRDQGGTNSVAGNVTDEQANVLAILRVHQREVASDRMHRVIKGVDAQSVPDQ